MSSIRSSFKVLSTACLKICNVEFIVKSFSERISLVKSLSGVGGKLIEKMQISLEIISISDGFYS